jgi:hypothetical protein
MSDAALSGENKTNRYFTFFDAQANRALVWAARMSLRVLRQTKAGEFMRDVVFAFLPFKMCFRMTMWFRHFVSHGALDRHFVFFCGPLVGNHLYWIFNSSFSKQYANEIVFYLVLCGYQRETLTLFRRLKWADDNADLRRLLEEKGMAGDGHSMDVRPQIDGA